MLVILVNPAKVLLTRECFLIDGLAKSSGPILFNHSIIVWLFFRCETPVD